MINRHDMKTVHKSIQFQTRRKIVIKNSTDMRVIRSRTLMENALIFILENEGIKGLSVKTFVK